MNSLSNIPLANARPAYDFNAAVQAFAKVCDISFADAQDVVEHLSPTKPSTDFFYNLGRRLPILKFTSATHESMKAEKYVQGQMQENTLIREHVSKGSYGKVYMSIDKKRVYKMVFLRYDQRYYKTGQIDKFVRDVLLEAWIQTVLSNDPVYGKYVVPVQGIFGVSTQDPNFYMVYIQMPALYKNLYECIDDLVIKNKKPVVYMDLRAAFKGIAEALAHFKATYGFHHRDLHYNNIMFRDKLMKVPMLIDFGRSCLTWNGVTYHSLEYDFPKCESNDLLILFMSLICTHMHNYSQRQRKTLLDSEVLNFFDQALSTFDEKNSVYNLIYDGFIHKYSLPLLFHAVYPDKLQPGEEEYEYLMRNNAFPMPNLSDPEAFLQFMENEDKAQIELFETPAVRDAQGIEKAERMARKLRTTTMQYRHPLVRQTGTRHLIGGARRTRQRKTRKN